MTFFLLRVYFSYKMVPTADQHVNLIIPFFIEVLINLFTENFITACIHLYKMMLLHGIVSHDYKSCKRS